MGRSSSRPIPLSSLASPKPSRQSLSSWTSPLGRLREGDELGQEGLTSMVKSSKVNMSILSDIWDRSYETRIQRRMRQAEEGRGQRSVGSFNECGRDPLQRGGHSLCRDLSYACLSQTRVVLRRDPRPDGRIRVRHPLPRSPLVVVLLGTSLCM